MGNVFPFSKDAITATGTEEFVACGLELDPNKTYKLWVLQAADNTRQAGHILVQAKMSSDSWTLMAGSQVFFSNTYAPFGEVVLVGPVKFRNATDLVVIFHGIQASDVLEYHGILEEER